MAKNPFDEIDNAKIGMPNEPFLSPRNVRRDMTLHEDKNIVSWEPAKYLLRIDDCDLKETRNSGDAFKAKLNVEHCFDQKEGDGTNAVGSTAVFMVMASTDGFARDVKTFCCTAMNYNPDLFKKADAEAVVSRAQPITARQRYVLCTVGNVKTQSKGNDFTTHKWEAVEVTRGPDGKITAIAAPAVDEVAEWLKRNKSK